MTECVSVCISNFLNLIADAQSHYDFCMEELIKQDKLTQDYLHKLELDNLKCNERSKIATQLVINRKDRRYYKDRIEELEPLIVFFNEPANRKILNNLKPVLGAIRKAENYHKNRTYVPKILREGATHKSSTIDNTK